MNRLKFVISVLKIIIFGALFVNEANAQSVGFIANDDFVKTGPLQTLKVNVVLNDVVTCDNYTLSIITVLDTVMQGTAYISGNFVVFTPGANARNIIVPIEYELSCGGQADTAILWVEIGMYNLPANIIDPNIACYDTMPKNINFGTPLTLFTTSSSTGDCVDGFSSPMVADLNGDGKPEIVMVGVNNAYNAGTAVSIRYINIYNGQTGALMYQHNMGSNFSWTATPYHRAPSQIALADLDNDGDVEIVVAWFDGSVYALKPVFNGTNITGMTTIWTSTVDFTAPLTLNQSTSSPRFYSPMPYIADLNGDGIPEVIVYNKIYNGQTGDLLMSWQNDAPTPKFSSIAAGVGGLSGTGYSSLSQADANSVKNSAMTGRRPVSGTYSDPMVAVSAIVDIDGDGNQEIITGNRIHKFQFNSLTDHTQNTYTTIEGPASVTIRENPNDATTTHWLSDGFTRVADIDGDGKLDIIVVQPCDNGSLNTKILVYVWCPDSLTVKAASTFYSSGSNGNFGIPFIGDINGKLDGGWDGTSYTKKLPEICMIVSRAYVNRSTSNSGRSGLDFHNLADNFLLTNNTFGTSGSTPRHIIGITYDDQYAIDERLRISWAMEHDDNSHNTGMTLFDFDNDGAMDICYRDQSYLMVVSPGMSGRDWVGTSPTDPSIMFRTSCGTGTGFEYPTIADINGDGSANIIVTSNNGGTASVAARIIAFGHNGQKWAPCPPIWNQGMYDPTQVREDGKINARPQSMLTPYLINGDTIYPYNGSWVQQPIVKDGSDYVPVVRLPDAMFTYMEVKVLSSSSAQVTLTIANRGTATIGAFSPISFYNGGMAGDSIGAGAVFLGAQNVGVDIFPGEVYTLDYFLTGNFNDCLIWARIMANDTQFPAIGYEDCDYTNNTLSGIDCPGMIFSISATPSNIICTANDIILLKTDYTTAQYATTATYQWYKDNQIIPSATDSFYYATQPGDYRIYITDSICRKFSDTINIRIVYVSAPPITITIPSTSDTVLCATSSITLNATYTDDGTFGSSLIYHWQHCPTGDTNNLSAWITIASSTGTSPLNVSHTIASMSVSDTGYYRLLVSSATSVCPAVSAAVRLGVNFLPIVSIRGMYDICVGITTHLFPTAGGTWRSLDTTTAAVTNDGLVTGLSAGATRFLFTVSETGCFDTTDVVSIGDFPVVNPILAARNSVCENADIQLSNTSTGGEWRLSNTNAQIMGNPNDNPVTIRGLTPGKVYVSYTVGAGTCQSTATFLMKIASTTPLEMIIGIQR